MKRHICRRFHILGISAFLFFFSISSEISPVSGSECTFENPAKTVSFGSEPNLETGLWPQAVGVHNIGNVAMTITDQGNWGECYARRRYDPETGMPLPSFDFPINSGLRYLCGGTIWVGGILEGDTVVSVGADGWHFQRDFWPNNFQPGLFLVGGKGDKTFQATYSDTFLAFDPDYFSPLLNCILIDEKSYSWATPPYNDFVIIEQSIRNIGDRTVNDAWIGIYMDGDVMAYPFDEGYNDDIVGFLDDFGIPYIMDNDGHQTPEHDDTWTANSLRGAIGIKFLDITPLPPDTNFNWWLSNTNSNCDWGPRYIGDLPVDSLPLLPHHGTPEGDWSKYYIMSNGEHDFDMLWTTVVTQDSTWLPYPDPSEHCTKHDVRFIYSFGPFNLPPGDSVKIAYAVVAAENVHQIPNGYSQLYDPNNPEIFYNTLDFSDLISNAAAAEELFLSDFLAAPPLGPVSGVELVASNGDSAVIKWCERDHPDVIGYNIYIKPVPDSQILFGDSVIGYRDTIGMEEVTDGFPVTKTSFTIENLIDGQMYFVSVTTLTSGAEGRKSRPVYFTCGRPRAPIVDSNPIYLPQADTVTINWMPLPDNDIDHYNIYRLIGQMEYSLRYGPTITQTETYKGDPYDSTRIVIIDGDTIQFYFFKMEPYTSVSGQDTSFLDFISPGEIFYYITATDSAGQESDTSDAIHIFASPLEKKDFLIYLPNDGGSGSLISADTVINFYEKVLDGYQYDFFILRDSGSADACPDESCFEWSTLSRYRNVICDDYLQYNIIFMGHFGPLGGQLLDFAESGGNVIYFGWGYDDNDPVPFDYINFRYFNVDDISYQLFGLDSAIIARLEIYSGDSSATEDTIGGLILAETVEDRYPDLEIDTNRFWWADSSWMNLIWPYSTPPLTGNLFPNNFGQPIYTYRSLYPSSSLFEGLPCGVKNESYAGDVFSFAFRPWFFKEENVKMLFNAIFGNTPTVVAEDENLLPAQFILYQNYPNPFNASTSIEFELPHACRVNLDIYNILGQRVFSLINDILPGGHHSIIWNGTDNNDIPVASGIYLYRIKADKFINTRKMVIVK